jgi:hypothetical protein
MTISQTMSLKSVISGEDVQLAPAQLAYFNARAEAQAHSILLRLFVDLSRDGKVTKASLARRLGKSPEQITRWLGAPGNFTLKSFSSLLACMGYEPTFGARPLNSLPRANFHHPLAPYQEDDRPVRNSGAYARIEDVEMMTQ